MIPALAFLYSPLGSRFSASSTGISTKTSMNSSSGSSGNCWDFAACRSRATWRSALYGEMKEHIEIVEESAKSLETCPEHQFIFRPPLASCVSCAAHTSAILLMFSFLSFSEKPKSLFSPKRTLSPSRRYAANPRWSRCCSSAVAMVDFPDAERPVNHMVMPRCLREELRSARERDGCHVMLLH